MNTLASLASLDTGPQPVGEQDTWADYRATIEAAIASQPRSQQKRIGPSEIGNPCTRCLTHKLIGTPETERHAPWLPWIGTAVHAQLEDVFMQANADRDSARYLVESTVCVGQIGGQDITGHADLFDLQVGEVTDWKVVGATTLRNAKANGPSETYRTQAHLYGLGFAYRGLTVHRVRIAYLPRNSVHLGDAHVWSEPFDPVRAMTAIRRADDIAQTIDKAGPHTALDAAGPHTGSEHSCSKYPDANQASASGPGHDTTHHLLNIA